MDFQAFIDEFVGYLSVAAVGGAFEVIRRLKNRLRAVEGETASLRQFVNSHLIADPTGQLPILRVVNLKVEQLERDGKLLENQGRITDSLNQVSRNMDRISDSLRDKK